MKQPYVFERLLELPLFQGLSRSEIYALAEKVKMDFRRQPKGHCFARQDEACTSLRFVLNGEVCVVNSSMGQAMKLSEWLSAPMVLQPECLFGWTQRYTRSFYAASTLQTLVIDKAAVRDLLFLYPAFRINFLNIISTRAQQAEQRLWHITDNSLRQRLLQFVTSRCLYPAGKKEISVNRNTLAERLQVTPRNLSAVLREMQAAGWMELHRERIVIPQLERLLQGDAPTPVALR